MASLYKKLIARNLTRNILKNFQHANLQEMETKIERLVRVSTVKKDRDSQFVIYLSQLAQCLEGKFVNLEQLQSDENVEVSISHDAMHFKAEPTKFAQQILKDINTCKDKYGYLGAKCDAGKHVGVEFSSPNVAKPFHVGHLRSTIIGNVISNLYEAAGHTVKRMNWVGDWGTQFGLLSLGLMKFGDIEHLKKDPLLELFNVYVKINQTVASECGKNPESTSPTYQEGMSLFTQLEKGEDNLVCVWKMIKSLSLEELDKMYQRLGVHFTHIMSESDYHEKTQEVLDRLSQNNLLQYDSEGVGYVKMFNEEVNGRATVVKSDGSSLYLTRDIASALDRQEKFLFDRFHYVVEHGQRAHFTKLVNILQQLGVPWANGCLEDIHIRFGRVKGMSSREGNVVFLRDVLDEARSRVLRTMQEKTTTRVSDDMQGTADILGVSSIILQDLKGRRINDYMFSWEKMLNLKADSGVFVQYCHARMYSMMTNCGVHLAEDEVDVSCVVQDLPLRNIVLHLARYPDVFEHSLATLEPHHLVQYLYTLCHFINVAYSSCPVKGESQDVAQARLLAFKCAKQVLYNCLVLLGLKPLNVI